MRHTPMPLYTCPCCGYRTLTSPPRGRDICPICCWEDDGDCTEGGTSWDGSNQVSLRDAQRNYLSIGACERHWLGDVRAPRPSDERDPEFRTLDEQQEATRLSLIERIATCFADVTLGEGISIEEARAIDEWGDRAAARRIDAHLRWQELSDEYPRSYSDTLSFMDVRGFRHAAPAFLTWVLRHPNDKSICQENTESALRRWHQGGALSEVLTEAQLRVLTDYLEYRRRFG